MEGSIVVVVVAAAAADVCYKTIFVELSAV